MEDGFLWRGFDDFFEAIRPLKEDINMNYMILLMFEV